MRITGRVLVLGVGLFISQNIFAQNQGNITNVTFPVNAAAASMNLLFASPPLPMLDNQEDTYQVSIMPYTFDGKLDRDESDSDGCESNCGSDSFSVRSGEFDGFGLGLGYTRSLNERWSFYGLLMGARMTGDFSRTGEPLGNTSEPVSDVTDVTASYLMLSPSFVYHFTRKEGSRFAWTLFGGPTLTHASVDGHVRESEGAADGGDLLSEFDMEASKVMPGLLVGVQVGIDLPKGFRVIPFFILGGSFGDTTPKVSNITTDNGSEVLDSIEQGQTFPIGTGGGNFGAHLVYRPWGLSVNFTTFIRRTPLFVEYDGKGVELTQVSLAWSFGNHKKAE